MLTKNQQKQDMTAQTKKFSQASSPFGILLCLSDAMVMCVILVLCCLGRACLGGTVHFLAHLQVMPYFLVTLAVSAYLGLYAPIRPEPHIALKHHCLAVCLPYFLLFFFLFLTRDVISLSRSVLLVSLGLSLVILPLAHGRLFAWLARKRPGWAMPTVIFGDRRVVLQLFALAENRRFCLRPVAWGRLGNVNAAMAGEQAGACKKDSGQDPHDAPVSERLRLPKAVANRHGIESLPILDNTGQVASLVQELGDCCAVFVSDQKGDLALPDQELKILQRIFARSVFLFHAPVHGVVSLQEEARSGAIVVMTSRKLFDWRRRIMKRFLDITVCLALSPFLAIALLVLGVWIRLDSPGPVFFSQKRLGKDGKLFDCLKFRTMINNADAVLEQYLADNPDQAREFDRFYKLKDDPRITRVGKWLRAWSLDELPQVINVLKGEMSLVGPRPIRTGEIGYYGDDYEEYCSVCPGISGIWQVSGRNDLNYVARVALDRYYVTNWSFWLDIYILCKTIPVVLLRTGAY